MATSSERTLKLPQAPATQATDANPPVGWSVWWSRLTGRTARNGAWTLGDQLIVSATRFGISWVLARYTGQTEFGAYVFAYSILMFFSGVQTAAVTGPLMVLGASRERKEFKPYVTATAGLQAGVTAIITFVSLATAIYVDATGQGVELCNTLYSLAVALPFIQCHEFIRRVLFTKLMAAGVFFNDALAGAILVAGLWWLWRPDVVSATSPGAAPSALTGGNVFLCIALATAIAGTIGVYQIRGLWQFKFEHAGRFIRENLRFGRWQLGGFFGNYLFQWAPNLIVAAMVGLSGPAILEAPRLLLAPLNILLLGAANFLTPRASSRYAESGSAGLFDLLKHATIVIGVLFTAYAAMIAVMPGFWLEILYEDKYRGATLIVVLWAVVKVFDGLSLPLMIALTAARRPDLVMYATVGIGLSITAAAVGMTYLWGPVGAAVAVTGGKAVFLLVVGCMCKRALRPAGSGG